MATLGMTKLEAVNLILQGSGFPRVASLDTGGTSSQGDAEYFLDLWDRQIQTLGWPENTDFEKTHTPVASAVTMGSDTLWVRGAGRDKHRTFALRADALYDVDAGTTTISAAVELDVCKKLTFADLAPSTKDLIVGFARMNYSVHTKGDPELTRWHATQVALFDLLTQRIQPRNRPEVNPAPLMAGLLAKSSPNA